MVLSTSQQINDNRLSLRYLGVPIKESFMFGDNETVVNSSSTVPAGKLNKRHLALSWYVVRDTITAKRLRFIIHIPGAINPADMLGKHWGY